jgi:hypothetical protein
MDSTEGGPLLLILSFDFRVFLIVLSCSYASIMLLESMQNEDRQGEKGRDKTKLEKSSEDA